jgi:hypothetical protein
VADVFPSPKSQECRSVPIPVDASLNCTVKGIGPDSGGVAEKSVTGTALTGIIHDIINRTAIIAMMVQLFFRLNVISLLHLFFPNYRICNGGTPSAFFHCWDTMNDRISGKFVFQ